MAKKFKFLYNLYMDLEIDFKICQILKHAIDQTPVPYIITDDVGKILYVNDAVLNATGYTREELIGKKTSIFKSGKHNSEFYKKMWDTISKGNFFSSRMINKKKDGSFYQVRVNIQPIKIGDKVSFYLSREEDLTNIIELESKLIESQKLESVALMLGELSHDFNNFLTVIIGSLELIKDEMKQGSVYEQLLIEILKSAKDQANMIKQLLTFARKSVPVAKETDINNLLCEIKPLIQAQITSKNKLIYELSEDLKRANIDEQLIKQALLNLTANARDSIEGTGTIKIKTYNHKSNDEYTEPFHVGEYAVIEVLDNGKGLNDEALKHLFEPFFTTKPKGKGTGLGLSSVYGIVKNHNGYIYGSNRKDTSGASFRIYIPAI